MQRVPQSDIYLAQGTTARGGIRLAKDKVVKFQGADVPAVALEFEGEKEPWVVYRLEDGSVLKFKQVLVDVARLTDRTKPDGDPIYVFNAAGIVSIDVAPELKKGPVSTLRQ